MPRYDVDHWLNLFSMAFLLTMVVVMLYFMCIVPIAVDAPTLIMTPYSTSLNKAPEIERDVNVGLRVDGRILFQGRQVSRREVVKIMEQAPPDRSIRVYAETGVPFRYVRGLTAAARDAGRDRLTFLVRPLASHFLETFLPPSSL